MPPPPVPPNEDQRVAALHSYDILDTAEEEIYDAITRAAAEVCCTPMASLTFIDTDRQWFKASIGFAVLETSRDISFCAHAINGCQPFIVEDASVDDRFRDYSNVTGDPRLRFYAGVPLVTPAGLALGTLCVLDTVPRVLSAEQTANLRTLAESALRVMDLRRNAGIAVFAKAVDMTSDGVIIAAGSPGGGATTIYANESFLRFTGYDYHETINQPCTFPIPPGRTDVQRAFESAYINSRMTTVEAQFKNPQGQMIWDRISFVPYVDDRGELVYVVAIHRDISAEKELQAQAQQLHAMRTTLATVDHVVRNFMNAAQLYSYQASSGQKIDAEMQQSFDAAMQKTHRQLASIAGMTEFKDRPTPFGVSLLDTELSR